MAEHHLLPSRRLSLLHQELLHQHHAGCPRLLRVGEQRLDPRMRGRVRAPRAGRNRGLSQQVLQRAGVRSQVGHAVQGVRNGRPPARLERSHAHHVRHSAQELLHHGRLHVRHVAHLGDNGRQERALHHVPSGSSQQPAAVEIRSIVRVRPGTRARHSAQ